MTSDNLERELVHVLILITILIVSIGNHILTQMNSGWNRLV